MTPRRYRGSIAVWAALLAYASFYPFQLRIPSPEAVSAFFAAPRYVIRSDIAFNVVAYMPLGTLTCLYLRTLLDRHAILKAALFGAAFSLAMELVQLFVPNRVATFADLVANAGGALIGALVFADPFYSMVTRRLGAVRDAAIIPGAWGDASLVLLMLWFLAQLNPAIPFFGAGDIAQGEGSLRLLQWAAVGMSICGFGLFISTVLRNESGSLRVSAVLLSVALWLKFAFASLMLQPHFSAEWVSTGRMLGLAGGIAAFVPLRRLGRPARIYLGFVLLLAGALFSKIFGAYSPLEEFLRLFRWPHGQLGSFATLTRFLHELWPFAAVVFLASLFVVSRKQAVR
ncbi:MAG TPA: VanZ family protein [Usitatibacter sp.]|nr:VanZ family protein [Usitatibacter sp.]